MALLDKVKGAMRIAVNAYDTELTALINAALADLRVSAGIADNVATAYTNDPLVIQATITYCRAHFGSPADYDRLKASYDEQKAQMQYATGYGIEEVCGNG